MALLFCLLVAAVTMEQGVKAEPICEVQGQVVVECAGCQATCADLEPPCVDICEIGCACPAETPVLIEDAIGWRCGVLDECVVPESEVEIDVTEAPAKPAEGMIVHQSTEQTPESEAIPRTDIMFRKPEMVPETKEAEPRTAGMYEEPEMNAVFFSAYTAAEDSIEFDMDTILPFSRTFVNLGDGFDTEMSVFVCPTTGYYAFSMTMSGVNGGLGVAIMCDEEVVSPLAFSTEAGAMSTNTIVLCKEGQKVYAQVKLQSGLRLFWKTVNGMSLNGFSGRLISTM